MNFGQLMDVLPLWAVFLATAGIILLSMELGYRLGSNELKPSDGEKKPYTGPIVAASLGLLAFMLAFTFGAVSSRLDARKQLILDEANAIGTTYLRAGLLPESQRAEIRRTLQDYITMRIGAAQTDDVELMLGKSQEFHDRLWSQVVAIAEQNPSLMASLYIRSLNELIDLHEKRITVGLHTRMPGIFWIALYGLLVLAMAVAGYDARLAGARRSITSVALALAFSVVVLLVVALDRPMVGMHVVSQQALIDVQKSISEQRH